MGDDQPLIDVGGGIHGREGRSQDLTRSLDTEIQHSGENLLHANHDSHTDGGAQKYGRIAAEGDVSIARHGAVREANMGTQEGGASSATPSAPNQQKLQRRTEIGGDIAAARAAAQEIWYENSSGAEALAKMPLVEAGGTGATAGAVQYGSEAGVATTAANLTLRPAKESPGHRDNRNMMAAAQEAEASMARAATATTAVAAAMTTVTTGEIAVGAAETQSSMVTQAATGSEATAAAVATTETTESAAETQAVETEVEEHQEAGTQAQKQRRKRKRGGQNPHLGKDQRDDQKRERERDGKSG